MSTQTTISENEILNAKSKELIREAISITRKIAFTPEYANKVSDSEVMGVIISRHFDWQGRQIAEVAFAALEDSNFHKESGLFNEMWKKENPGESDLWIATKEDAAN